MEERRQSSDMESDEEIIVTDVNVPRKLNNGVPSSAVEPAESHHSAKDSKATATTNKKRQKTPGGASPKKLVLDSLFEELLHKPIDAAEQNDANEQMPKYQHE
uniref:Uncharacterized protein n=1 Tax=Plectus sambesii TaxID=2011161 RepID=A0A914X999_9BILA